MENGKQDTKELTFVPTVELIEELKRRHDSMVFMGLKFKDISDASRYVVLPIYHGNRHVCLSLLSQLSHRINLVELASLNKSDD